jgi:hypothetical protein
MEKSYKPRSEPRSELSQEKEKATKWPKSLVEMRGFEPLTSCMRSRRSSS